MKETWDKQIVAAAEICARSEDLIAYLYGEASQLEARNFEKHAEQCSSCRAELSAFGNVREAIGEWRQQALGTIMTPAFETKTAEIPESKSEVYPKRRSAFAALREFFTLSPAWMRAATAVAALVFCALAAIAVAYFVQQPQTVVIEKPMKVEYSKEELQTLVDDAIKKQKSNIVNEQSVSSPEKIDVAVNKPTRIRSRATQNSSQVANNNGRHQLSPRRLNAPSTELVRADDYLPFTASKDEEKLPSLSDLVSEDN